jgi:hypothetical protein
MSSNVLATTWNRLKASLPGSLHGKVQAAEGGRYRLDLEPHHIHVISLKNG